MPTKIEWCDETINPIQDKIKGKTGRGYHCTKVSTGCLHCYAEVINKRFGNGIPFDGRDAEFELIESELERPIKWRKPKRIFVQSMGDIFHEKVTNKQIDQIFTSMIHPMGGISHHIYLILTKRPERILAGHPEHFAEWPNIWLGVTCENQQAADERIPILLQIPATIRFVSCEPLLSEINLEMALENFQPLNPDFSKRPSPIQWVIVGGESGLGDRPMHPNWARSIRNQCQAADVPFFMKQMSGKTAQERHEIPKDLFIREYPLWAEI